mgnify:CR=1 FL=1
MVRDGKLIAAGEEERFTRKKHDFGFPENAIRYCLREAGITIDEVDHIGFYEKPLVKFNRILETILAYWPLTYRAWLTATPLCAVAGIVVRLKRPDTITELMSMVGAMPLLTH